MRKAKSLREKECYMEEMTIGQMRDEGVRIKEK